MDELRERLLRAEGTQLRPRVCLPSVAALRRAARVRAVRRGVLGTMLAVALSTWTLWPIESRHRAFTPPGTSAQLDANLAVIAARESAAAVRFALAVRAKDPRPDLRVILDRYPDTTSALRAKGLLESVTDPTDR
ncbi:MAG: hypothetical protein AB7I19_16170 [Planctomycetota bacterium]